MKVYEVRGWMAPVLRAVVLAWEVFKLATVFGIGIIVFRMLGWL